VRKDFGATAPPMLPTGPPRCVVVVVGMMAMVSERWGLLKRWKRFVVLPVLMVMLMVVLIARGGGDLISLLHNNHVDNYHRSSDSFSRFSIHKPITLVNVMNVLPFFLP